MLLESVPARSGPSRKGGCSGVGVQGRKHSQKLSLTLPNTSILKAKGRLIRIWTWLESQEVFLDGTKASRIEYEALEATGS